jgi:hypothetical protein
MKKGHLIKKENSWFIRVKQSKEGDDVIITDYPLSLTSSYYAGFSLKEGKEVNFEIETEVYTDLGEERIQWAVLQSPITRVEVINHTSDKHPIGRIFAYHGNAEVSMQDGGKTLKIFI